jgi:PAS domain-containing protein
MILASNPAAVSSNSPGELRIVSLLEDGEKSLRDGDLESAKEQFDKASALGERNGRVAADLAHLATIKADMEWLHLRLLAADDASQTSVRRELDESLQRLRKTVTLANEVAPGDFTVIRARIDALRIADDLEGARRLVPELAPAASQPDSALTLAELDLGEAKPDWPTLLSRLRVALGAEQNIGRARSALVFALARSGDIAGANAELERLAGLPRPQALQSPLRAYVSRLSKEKAIDPSSLPDAPRKGSSGASSPPPASPRPSRGARPSREKPASHETPTSAAPEEHVPLSAPVDTSDLPGVQAPPSPTPPSSPAPAPPGVDTSDLPSFK